MPDISDGTLNMDELERLLTAAAFKDDAANWEHIVIRRKGQKLLEFSIRPLDELELAELRRECTRYMPNPAGREYPRIEGEVNLVKLRSLKIYTATVSADRARMWDDPQLQQRLGVMRGEDVIDCVLMAGEKDAVIERIDAISGYGAQLVEAAKN